MVDDKRFRGAAEMNPASRAGAIGRHHGRQWGCASRRDAPTARRSQASDKLCTNLAKGPGTYRLLPWVPYIAAVVSCLTGLKRRSIEVTLD